MEETKKNTQLLGTEKKNHATSCDKKKVTQPLRTKKITQPLGTKKSRNLLVQIKSHNLLGQKSVIKIQILVTFVLKNHKFKLQRSALNTKVLFQYEEIVLGLFFKEGCQIILSCHTPL